jgi:putative nucleotidyltransferase with HDIG domain
VVGRYGGEEFALVLANVERDGAKAVAERIRAALANQPCLWSQEQDDLEAKMIPISASIGIAIYPEHGSTSRALIEAADLAMYHAKRSGRNRVCMAGEEIVQDVLASVPEGMQVDGGTLQALTVMANAHDKGTSQHAHRMVQLTEATARLMGRSEEEIHLVRLAALLHDIGKIGVSDAILNKPGPLTQEEWSVMRHHPVIGREILVKLGGQFELLSHIVVSHHERWDGKGYPYGRAGEAIPLGARILSVVDSYDAMISERPYRKPMSDADARAELRRCAGGQFDPQVVEAFLQALDESQLIESQEHLQNPSLL